MNKFYEQNIVVQWILAFLIFIVGFIPFIILIELAHENALYYLFFFVILPFGQFGFSPLMKLTGVHTYYSPMLLSYMANDKQIDLHSGTSFDYLFVMRGYKPGTEFRNKLLAFQLEGLINIITRIETGKIPEAVTIAGTSYFFSERTIKKLGFQSVKPAAFYRFNLLANFIDITWMYSLSKGQLAFPKLLDAKKAQISGADLVKSKAAIQKYLSLVA